MPTDEAREVEEVDEGRWEMEEEWEKNKIRRRRKTKDSPEKFPSISRWQEYMIKCCYAATKEKPDGPE